MKMTTPQVSVSRKLPQTQGNEMDIQKDLARRRSSTFLFTTTKKKRESKNEVKIKNINLKGPIRRNK